MWGSDTQTQNQGWGATETKPSESTGGWGATTEAPAWGEQSNEEKSSERRGGGRGRGRGGRGGRGGGRGGGQRRDEQKPAESNGFQSNDGAGWGAPTDGEKPPETTAGGWGDQPTPTEGGGWGDTTAEGGNKRERKEAKGERKGFGEKVHPVKSDGWERIPLEKRKIVKPNPEEPIDLTQEDDTTITNQQIDDKKQIEQIVLSDDGKSSSCLTMDVENHKNEIQFKFELCAQPYASEILKDCKFSQRWQKQGLKLRTDRILKLTLKTPNVSLGEDAKKVLVCTGSLEHEGLITANLSKILETSKLSLIYEDKINHSVEVHIGAASDGLILNVYFLQSYLDSQLVDII